MKGKYKHSFDKVRITNRWKLPAHARPCDWALFMIALRWFGPNEYRYVISLLGIDINIWMKREWIKTP